jgi:glycosyltransferase involved in cell wall biosynthesis
MRIGFDARFIRDGFPGIGRYCHNLARALAELAADATFVVLYAPDAPNRRYRIEALVQPNVTLVPTEIPIRSVAEQVYLPRLARALSLDIYHAPYYITPYRMPCPQVLTVYDVISRRHPGSLSLTTRLIFAATTRLALHAADALLAISRSARRDLIDLYHVEPDRISVTPLAADPHFGPANADRVEAVKRRLGLPERYALCVGVDKPHKNWSRLVAAWSDLPAAVRAGYELVFAGRPDPRYAATRQLVAALGLDDVRFVGDVAEDDLPALYTGAALFVFPSLYEGFGLPILEAMACGTPVACSNTSSLPEVAGDAAAYFDPTDVADMAATLAHVLSDSAHRQALAELALTRAAQFSWSDTARATLAVYRAVAQRSV